MKKAQVFLATLGIIAVSAIVIVALIMARQPDQQDRFSVDGSGTIYAKADIANIQVGVKTGVKKTAVEASAASTDKMDKIIDQLKKLGIDEKDIQTSDYNLSPSYNWTEKTGQTLIGYEVTQNLSLKIRDLSKIGDVIAKTTEQGANQIGNIAFTIDDEFSLRNQARELAIGKAKEKAGLIAQQSGIKLGKIIGFSENAPSPVYPLSYSNAKMDLGAGSSSSVPSPNIQAGQNEIKVDVSLVYEVK